uniref:Uncharacterized protein n=1 Tax=Siphoviridae sp. ctLgc23 TaxID=2825455 RepID=A0A8S5QJH7_9CAUD|nr:MAG TPA: hypothetical protein [Siphoviridae sp. ctLgc23]
MTRFPDARILFSLKPDGETDIHKGIKTLGPQSSAGVIQFHSLLK